MKSLLASLTVFVAVLSICSSMPELTKVSAAEVSGNYQQALLQAQVARKRDDWKATETALRSACRLSSNNTNRNASAEFALGELLSDSMRYGEAEQHFRNAYFKCRTLDMRERALVALAQCNFISGQYAQSLRYLQLLASSQNLAIRQSSEVIAGLNAYYAGNQKKGLEHLSLSLDKYSRAVEGEKTVRKYADCFAQSSRPKDAAIIFLKLLNDEKRRSGLSSKQSNDLAYEAASALSRASGFSAQSFLPMLLGVGEQSSAQAKLKLSNLVESVRNNTDVLDQKMEETLKLSIEQYGPDSEKTKTFFERNIHFVKSFGVRKRCIEMMINALRSKFAESSDEVCACEEELAVLYSEIGQDGAANEIYSAILAKIELSQDVSNSANYRRYKLYSILGEFNLGQNNLQLAELQLGKAVVLGRKMRSDGFSVWIVQQYIDVLRKLGKSDKLKEAEADLEEAKSKVQVHDCHAFDPKSFYVRP